MAKPFYSNLWNPIRHGYFPQGQIQPHSTKPKVFNIPVHFVGSDNATSKQSPAPATVSTVPTIEARVLAAVTIQRALRGFLVRKNTRVVRQVAAEVDEIDRKLREEDVKILMDAKERLRHSEMLMAFLFRLDSVRGVRDFRRKVIRRVINLQEAIDSISMVTNSTTKVVEDSSIDHVIADQTLDQEEEKNKHETELEMEIPAAVELPKRERDLIAGGIEDDQEGSSSEAADESSINHEKEETNADDIYLPMDILAADESSKRMCNLISDGIGKDESRSSEAEEEIPNTNEEEGASMVVSAEVAAKREEGEGIREVMERIVTENDKLKGMLAQLCARSAEQCRLMESLADRVENLERVVHRIDRRKKRRKSAAA